MIFVPRITSWTALNIEELADNNVNNGNNNVIGKKNSKRKLCFDGMDEDEGNYFSCNSNSSTPSSIGLNDPNSNSFKKIIHTPLPKRLKL